MSIPLRARALRLTLCTAIALTLSSGIAHAADLDALAQRVRNASVRIKVSYDNQGNYGSGTIVAQDGSSALIATCGHLFEDEGTITNIKVTLFPRSGKNSGGEEQVLQAEALAFDLERDVALIRVTGLENRESIPLASAESERSIGEPLVVAGCDYGNDIGSWQCKLTSVDRSFGPPTIGVSALPRHGRSGGPAVTAHGELVGVCNAMDAFHEEGVYASVESIHRLLSSIGNWRNAQALPSEAQQDHAGSLATKTNVNDNERVGASNVQRERIASNTKSGKHPALFIANVKPGTPRKSPSRAAPQ